MKNLLDIIKHYFVAAFISICTLIAITISYLNHNNGFELSIALFGLLLFGLISPIIMLIEKNINLKIISKCLIVLILLYFEIFLWVIIFNGIKALPNIEKLPYFILPFFIYFAGTFIGLLFKKILSKNEQ
jgi:hypothetical protein